jgi:IclR family KDG regulon transcriptional repressor
VNKLVEGQNPIKSVSRLVAILNCFTADRPSWPLTELSKHLGWPKATTHRYLKVLETYGLLYRSREDKSFRLGYKLYMWGSLAAEAMPLREIARPIMQKLKEETGEMVVLMTYHNQEVVCIEKIDTEKRLRVALDIGRHQAPHASSSCRVIMAFLPEAEIMNIIREKGLPKICENTITDADTLLAKLGEVRAKGYAHSCEEVDPDVCGISAPIFDHKGAVIAGISVLGPIYRFTEDLVEPYSKLVKEAARKITEQLSDFEGRERMLSEKYLASSQYHGSIIN